jgi:hypothetical protein
MPDEADALRELRNAVRAYSKIPEIEQRRADAIRQAIAAGIPTARIAEITGLTQQRIYQIRNGK